MGLKCRVGAALGLCYLANSALSAPSSDVSSGWRSRRASDPCQEIASTYNPGKLNYVTIVMVENKLINY